MRQRDVLISAWLIRSSGRTVRADSYHACEANGRPPRIDQRERSLTLDSAAVLLVGSSSSEKLIVEKATLPRLLQESGEALQLYLATLLNETPFLTPANLAPAVLQLSAAASQPLGRRERCQCQSHRPLSSRYQRAPRRPGPSRSLGDMRAYG